MALEFEVTDISGIDESLQSLYVQDGDKYRLDVSGIDTGEELKNALKKERESSKEASKKLKELEAQQEEAQRKILEEQGKYKELSEREKKEKIEVQTKLEELTQKIALSKRDKLVNELASEMTSDSIEQKIIAKFALDYTQIEGDEANFSKDLKEIQSELSTFVSNKAKGSNDTGGTKGDGETKTMARSEFTELAPDKQMSFIKDGGTLTE